MRQALPRAHIFAYLSIFPETSCIAAIEALSAGCYVVCPRYGALPETTGGFSLSYDWHDDRGVHAQRFASALSAAIHGYRTPEVQRRLGIQKQATDLGYDWKVRAAEWKALFESVTQPSGVERAPL